ncbi:MAG TPA: hypothetical protein VGO97_00725 [Solirubrobacterales bacterium]|jgi:hypothetical protein|nr:hypothetical protein [Solirubrobacterales bacterium]
MICTLTARRIQAGKFDEFKRAFQGADEGIPEDVIARWKDVYFCRDITDENVALTFGFFDGSVSELREIQSQSGRDEQLGAMASFVEEILFDGSFEVLDHMTPADFMAQSGHAVS